MTMRVLPTRVHAVSDYVTGPVLTAAPTIFRLHGERGSSLPPRILGAAATAYSALTDYELGVKRVIPMRVHLALDGVGGAALAAVPWMTGAARKGVRHWLPHAVVGAQEIALALTTRTSPPPTRQRLSRYALLVGAPALAAAGGVATWRVVASRRGAAPEPFEPVHPAANEPLARESAVTRDGEPAAFATDTGTN